MKLLINIHRQCLFGIDDAAFAAMAGSVLSGGAALFGNHQQLKQQKELMHENEAINLAQWNRTNEYNDPSKQMERLRKAGLNPDLAIGGFGSSTADNAQLTDGTPSAPHTAQSYVSAADSVQRAALLPSEIEKNKAIAKNQNEESREHAANVTFKDSSLGLQLTKLAKDIGLTEAQTNESLNRGQMYSNQSNLIIQNTQNAKQQFELMAQQHQLNELEIERMQTYTKQYGDMLQAQLDNLISSTGLNQAHANKLKAETSQIWATFNSIVEYWSNMADMVAADEEQKLAMANYYDKQVESLQAQLEYLPYQMAQHMFYCEKYQKKDKDGNFVYDDHGRPVMREGAAAFERTWGYVNEVAGTVNTCADAVMKVGIGIGAAKSGMTPGTGGIPYRTKSGHQLHHQQTAKAYEDYLFETDPVKKGKKKDKFNQAYKRYEQ